jgi:hypothetical protein
VRRMIKFYLKVLTNQDEKLVHNFIITYLE